MNHCQKQRSKDGEDDDWGRDLYRTLVGRAKVDEEQWQHRRRQWTVGDFRRVGHYCDTHEPPHYRIPFGNAVAVVCGAMYGRAAWVASDGQWSWEDSVALAERNR